MAGNFWENNDNAKAILQQAEALRKIIIRFEKLSEDISDIKEFLEISKTDEEKRQIGEMLRVGEKEMEDFERFVLFSGEYDENNIFLTIQSGAGGVDAQDWAEMLLRMYLRWCELSDYNARIIDESRGTEAGIKSVTVQIEGIYAYGNLKHEAGIHRLVRLSPFNADQLRQTSFARVEVLPIIDSLKEIMIEEKDLRIDTFRASGAGGQHVNKTDSAVRITHLPSGIVTSCQNERSQSQNKERAIALLLAKLHQQAIEVKKQETNEIRGEAKSAQWGNQIRSYVLHPYMLVKDHRTGEETPHTREVLNGSIDRFIQASLRGQKKQM